MAEENDRFRGHDDALHTCGTCCRDTHTKLQSLMTMGADGACRRHAEFVETLMKDVSDGMLGQTSDEMVVVALVKVLGKVMSRGTLVNQCSVTRALKGTHVRKEHLLCWLCKRTTT